MNRLSIHIILLTVLITAILNISCSNMYSDMLEGTKIRAGVFLTNNSTCQMFFINSDGSFDNRTSSLTAIPAANYIKAAAVDYNNDDRCDISVLDDAGNLMILQGNGKGNFIKTFYNGTGSWPSAPNDMKAADFNSDGIPEYAISCNANQVIIYSPGSILFTIAAGSTNTITAGDITGDNKSDLYCGTGGGGSGIYINQSAGTTSFSSAFVHSVDDNGVDAAICDINGDGYNDLLRVSLSVGDGIYIYKNNGSGIFSDTHDSLINFNMANSISTADIDNDGDIDAVVSTISGAAYSLVNDGTGNFTAKNLPVNVVRAVFFDVDFDGDLDIISIYSNNMNLLKNDSNGNFFVHSSTAITASGSITIFTFQQD